MLICRNLFSLCEKFHLQKEVVNKGIYTDWIFGRKGTKKSVNSYFSKLESEAASLRRVNFNLCHKYKLVSNSVIYAVLLKLSDSASFSSLMTYASRKGVFKRSIQTFVFGSVFLKARLHLQLSLRFLVRFSPFDGCE